MVQKDRDAPTRRDYDSNPDRYRLGVEITAAHAVPGADLHAGSCAFWRMPEPCGYWTSGAVTER